MGKKFKAISLLLVGILVMFLAACGGTSDEESGDETAAESNEEVIEINIAHGNQPTEPVGQQGDKWKELVAEKSEGKVKVNVYPSSQLGAEKDVVEQAIAGNNVIIFTGYDFLMDYVADAGILTAPYLTEDYESLLKLTESEWFADLEQRINDEGIEIVNTNTIYGTRHLMTNDPVTSIEDLEGMKIRVPNNQMYIKTFESLGAAPTPLPLTDLYSSLQQGLIDGAENPLPVLEGAKVNEVSKHLTLTEHTKIMSPWIAGTSFIETLPEDVVQLLKETGIEAAEYGNQIMEEQSEQVLETFKEQGVEVHEVDLAEFREKAEAVYTAFPEWTEGLYETVKAELDKQ